jgi:hypothetical protein
LTNLPEFCEVFLTADVGLSGVNFGVVDSGTLCIVTNEGNGRMVTTLPPIHIALMGMERLLPNLADLALFLTLLPRSATGQKLSVYTQLLHTPLAGQERHLIILDNGRSALRASSLAEALYCIRCGACLGVSSVSRDRRTYLDSDTPAQWIGHLTICLARNSACTGVDLVRCLQGRRPVISIYPNSDQDWLAFNQEAHQTKAKDTIVILRSRTMKVFARSRTTAVVCITASPRANHISMRAIRGSDYLSPAGVPGLPDCHLIY